MKILSIVVAVVMVVLRVVSVSVELAVVLVAALVGMLVAVKRILVSPKRCHQRSSCIYDSGTFMYHLLLKRSSHCFHPSWFVLVGQGANRSP